MSGVRSADQINSTMSGREMQPMSWWAEAWEWSKCCSAHFQSTHQIWDTGWRQSTCAGVCVAHISNQPIRCETLPCNSGVHVRVCVCVCRITALHTASQCQVYPNLGPYSMHQRQEAGSPEQKADADQCVRPGHGQFAARFMLAANKAWHTSCLF